MLPPQSYVRTYNVIYLLFLLGLGEQQAFALEPFRAQDGSSRSAQNSAHRQSDSAAPGRAAIPEVFRRRCAQCHGVDGTGSRARANLPEIPDFTDASWQARRTRGQMMASILEGKGTGMPPHGGAISEEQAGDLVAYAGSFTSVPRGGKPGQLAQARPSLTSFDERFRHLQEQQDELRRKFREVSQVSPDRAPPKPSEPMRSVLTPQSSSAAPGLADIRALFHQRCAQCHGDDGTGSAARDRLPEIPDFTNSSWQARRTDAKLLASILDGKGDDMPPQGGKISEEQARGLVRCVRDFASAARKSAQDESSPVKRVGLAHDVPGKGQPAGGALEKQRPVPMPFDQQADSTQSLQRPDTRPPASEKPAASVVEALFRQHCVKCHGSDGTGNKKRSRWPEIPDFTNASWQARRSNAELTESILDGKGSAMPPLDDDVGEEQARGLVAYVRAFAPTLGKPNQEEKGGPAFAPTMGNSRQGDLVGPALAEPPETEAPLSFFEKLARWLGKTHPPAVHFPIALLTAAMVAELLRMATGKPAFDAISRYCIWFGTLTAVTAGALGWCAGSFRLTDASWVLMTHRWLGTSTTVCAVLVLLLSEASHRPDRRRTRMSFRVALLVVAVLVSATGFFGGAVVFGLNHYSWPK